MTIMSYVFQYTYYILAERPLLTSLSTLFKVYDFNCLGLPFAHSKDVNYE